MSKIIYITGGERSGKSSFAQKKGLELSTHPIYLATARIWDSDFKKRVEHLQQDRDERWTTIEEEKYISSHDFTGQVVVLDCITLWLTNLFTDNTFVVDETIKQAVEEFEKLTKQECTFIIVSNEIGMGVHADTLSVRKFTEIQGRINQLIASKATDVFLMISGIPIKIK